MPRILLVGLACLCACLSLSGADSLRLVSTDGQEITVYGILEARPEGMVIQMTEYDRLITVPWEKFDLEHLRTAYPDAYYGYMDAQHFNRSALLRMGGFAGILTYDEAISELYRGLQVDRFYSLPENVDYLFEDDPDVMRMKERDWDRYQRTMRDYRRELQDFLREIFPKEAIIISDDGALHRKEREDLVALDKGETSLGTILNYLADTRHTVSRVGLLYLREVSHFPEDFAKVTDSVKIAIPNETFRYGNANHMKLPTLLSESQNAVKHMMEAKSIYRGEQYKLGEFYNFVYGQAEEYGGIYSNKRAPRFNTSSFPRLDFSEEP